MPLKPFTVLVWSILALDLTTLALVTLKLTGLVVMSWSAALTPLWLPLLIAALVLLGAATTGRGPVK